MKYPVAWTWYAKWTVIYLVILPLLIWRFENIQLFHSHIAFLVVTGFTMGLAVRLIDRLFYFLVQHAGKKYWPEQYIWSMPVLSKAQKEILERKIVRWVWLKQCPVTATEIARKFSVDIHQARCLIQRIIRRADGIRCRLETVPGKNSAGHTGIVKYFSVQYLPESYQPSSVKRK